MRFPSRLMLSLATLALVAVPAATATAAPKLPRLKLVQINGFVAPVHVAAASSDRHRIFVVQKGGVISVVVDGRKVAKPFLDITTSVDSGGLERGMLSMAFSRDYATSGLLYVAYTAHNGDVTLEEYQRAKGNPNQADPSTKRTVLVQHHPHHDHNSGQLQFGPDGYLYMGLGDGGGSGDKDGNAQNLGTRLGKILRIDPRNHRQLAPSDNPFFGQANIAPEIYAYGFRNPWRFSFDRLTGAMAIADVGQNKIEEVDYLAKGTARGRNFGWDACEGGRAFPTPDDHPAPCPLANSVHPRLQLKHVAGFCAVIGGYTVRDRSLGAYYGRYVYADFCKDGLRTARLGAKNLDDRPTGNAFVAATAFGEDAGGCVYAASISGFVDRIRAVHPHSTPGIAGGPGCMPMK